MADAWHGPTLTDETVAFGPLALIAPLLQQLDIAPVIDRHLPPDPQRAFSHGRVLSLLLAARLCQPTALINVPSWAERTGADLLCDIPVDSLNDDRLGRALDAFFTQRHSILTAVAATAVQLAELSLDRLHFDPTHLIFHGADPSSQPRPAATPWPSAAGDDIPPAHITQGYGDDAKLIQVGVTSVVDELGAVPLLGQCRDGNHNGHTAIRQQCDWLLAEGRLRPNALLISDRGTFSVEHVARLHRHDCHVLCSVPWGDYRQLDDTHAAGLRWQRASYLSLEQQRRRDTGSSLPQEYYDLAVLRHTLTDPESAQAIPCRVLFVYSSADAAICRQTRERDVVRLRQGLEAIARTVARGHPQITQATIARRLSRLLGNRAATAFFRWEMVPLMAAEHAALPVPGRGCRRPTYRFHSTFDEAAAAAAAEYDGLAALLTTAPRQQSGDTLFTQYKQQNYVELGHHQWKTPLAVRPLFLKSPRRVEALVCLMQVALTAYQMLERLYRQSVAVDAASSERHRTTESLLRLFRPYGLIERRTCVGRVVHATRLTAEQSRVLSQLGFPTPAQLLAQVLAPLPLG
ncbi:MAG: IS1634 family transposase [Gemmataceae bacterium]